jgi:hypothetical protein
LNKLTVFATNTVSFVFDPHQCGLQVLNEFHLTWASRPASLFDKFEAPYPAPYRWGKYHPVSLPSALVTAGTIVFVFLLGYLQLFVDDGPNSSIPIRDLVLLHS